MGSFGLYKAGGSVYDRGIYLELYNACDRFRRDLKSSRTVISNPRCNICIMGHPNKFYKSIQEERFLKDDGLMQRFLSCSPKPSFLNSEEIREARLSTKPFSLSCVLYLIKHAHENITKYVFTVDAQVEFESNYSDYRKISEKFNQTDVFIR